MTRLRVFLAASLDGYIADVDGRLDWLEEAADPAEDYGYDAFIAGVDAVAMGRDTYDFIEHVDPLPYGNRPLFVFTHRPAGPRAGVTFWSLPPAEAAWRWDQMGFGAVYVDGGRLISSFLELGLVDDLTVTVVPRLLGDGRRLFHPIGRATGLRLDSVVPFPSGMVNLTYSRVRTGA